jgi:hypothetical protein
MAKKSRTRDTAADFARRSNATSRMNHPETRERRAQEERRVQEERPARPALVGKDFSPRPTPRPTRAPEESMRPVTRPDNLAERAELRKAMDSSDAAYRASRREAADIDMQGFAKGGMVTGSRAQISGTKFSGTF